MQATVAVTDDGWSEEEGGKTGIWLFIVSEILLFGAFFASYLSTRLGNPDCALGTSAWPEAGRLPGVMLAGLNTFLLLTSSYTMVRGIARAKRGDIAGLRANLGVTIALGVAFLLVKAFEYRLKISHGYFPGSEHVAQSAGLSIFLSYYYLMTSLHALHVIAGLVWNGVVFWAAGAGAGRIAHKAELAGLYWHFVDVVWVFLFPLFYLI